MLKVKTYIAPSTMPEAGNGCFAAEFIPKGTTIWEFNPFFDRVYTNTSLELMTFLEREFVYTYAYMHNGLYFLCIDNARFFNHSYDKSNTADPIDQYVTFAARDIQVGEEILSDYRTFGNQKADLLHNIHNL